VFFAGIKGIAETVSSSGTPGTDGNARFTPVP